MADLPRDPVPRDAAWIDWLRQHCGLWGNTARLTLGTQSVGERDVLLWVNGVVVGSVTDPEGESVVHYGGQHWRGGLPDLAAAVHADALRCVQPSACAA